jgi:adenosylmethionine-8-amino-7-oxononanoate aminotransferase
MVRLRKYGDRIELTPPLVVGEDQIGEIGDNVGCPIKAVA